VLAFHLGLEFRADLIDLGQLGARPQFPDIRARGAARS
jgi:hypothetical protein